MMLGLGEEPETNGEVIGNGDPPPVDPETPTPEPTHHRWSGFWPRIAEPVPVYYAVEQRGGGGFKDWAVIGLLAAILLVNVTKRG